MRDSKRAVHSDRFRPLNKLADVNRLPEPECATFVAESRVGIGALLWKIAVGNKTYAFDCVFMR